MTAAFRVIEAEKFRIKYQFPQGCRFSARSACRPHSAASLGAPPDFACSAIWRRSRTLFSITLYVYHSSESIAALTSHMKDLIEKEWPVWHRNLTMEPSSIGTRTP